MNLTVLVKRLRRWMQTDPLWPYVQSLGSLRLHLSPTRRSVQGLTDKIDCEERSGPVDDDDLHLGRGRLLGRRELAMAMSVTYTTIGGVIVHEALSGNRERELTADPLGSLVKIRTSVLGYSYSAEYWPYGEIQTQTGSNPTRWAFVGLLGYMRDLATMFYVRARYYRSAQTRWMTVDPLWPEELPYTYVRSSPLGHTDSSGTVCVPIVRACSLKDWKDAYDQCRRIHGTPVMTCVRIGVKCPCIESTIAVRKCWKTASGTCTPARHRALQKVVDDYCKPPNGARTCTRGKTMGCLDLIDNMMKFTACANARAQINRECFKGGNPGHLIAITEALKGALRCAEIISEEC